MWQKLASTASFGSLSAQLNRRTDVRLNRFAAVLAEICGTIELLLGVG
jgi:hypothetical protein